MIEQALLNCFVRRLYKFIGAGRVYQSKFFLSITDRCASSATVQLVLPENISKYFICVLTLMK